jgi:hypothetical protein
MEAAIRIELMDKGFADLCLTTWLRRLKGFQRAESLPKTNGYMTTNPATASRDSFHQLWGFYKDLL